MTHETTARRAGIGVAHEIATMLQQRGFDGPDGVTVLAMALGIHMEAQPGAHRELRPLGDGMLKAAQLAFDALRAGRGRRAGNA